MTTPNTTKEVEQIDPHNVKAGDIHARLFNAVTKAQMSITQQEMYDTRVEVFDSVKELLTSLTAKHEADKEKAVEVGKIQALHIIEDLYSKAVDKADLIEMVNEAILAPTKTDKQTDV